MHHLFILYFINKSIYFSPIFMKFGKYIKQCVINHYAYLFDNTLSQSVNTRSNVIYTIRGPAVIYALSIAAKIMSLYRIAKGKVKTRKKTGGDVN